MFFRSIAKETLPNPSGESNNAARRLLGPGIAGWSRIALAAGAVFLTNCTRPPEDDANRITFSIWGSVQQQRAEEELIEAFQEAHPEIEVDVLAIGNRYPEMIQAMFVGSVAPDVVMVSLTYYDEWASRGVLLDLTEEFNALDEEMEILPIPRRAVERDGRVYAIPINAHGQATFYNKDALADAGVELPEEGLTWDYLMELGPRLSRRAGNPDAPTDFLMLMPPLEIFFWQHGVQFFDDLFHPTRSTVNTPEAVEAVDLIRELHRKGFAVPPEVELDEGAYQLFRDGRIAFYFMGRWLIPEFDGVTDFDWDVAPMPAGPVSNITQHGGTTLAIWKDSPRKEAARKFLQFYGSYRGAEISMHWHRNVPIFRDVAYGEEFLDIRPPENIVHFSETMEDGASQFSLYAPGVQEVTRIFNDAMDRALSQPNVSSEAIISRLDQEFERWLERMRMRGIFDDPETAEEQTPGDPVEAAGQ